MTCKSEGLFKSFLQPMQRTLIHAIINMVSEPLEFVQPKVARFGALKKRLLKLLNPGFYPQSECRAWSCCMLFLIWHPVLHSFQNIQAQWEVGLSKHKSLDIYQLLLSGTHPVETASLVDWGRGAQWRALVLLTKDGCDTQSRPSRGGRLQCLPMVADHCHLHIHGTFPIFFFYPSARMIGLILLRGRATWGPTCPLQVQRRIALGLGHGSLQRILSSNLWQVGQGIHAIVPCAVCTSTLARWKPASVEGNCGPSCLCTGLRSSHPSKTE